jgi:hypothetical protein
MGNSCIKSSSVETSFTEKEKYNLSLRKKNIELPPPTENLENYWNEPTNFNLQMGDKENVKRVIKELGI